MKHIKTIILIFLLALGFSGCGENSDDKFFSALEKSGSNRIEIEKVLLHYAGEPEKLAAAKFLISNMPGHYSYLQNAKADSLYDALDSLLIVMNGKAHDTICDSINALCEFIKIGHLSMVSDINIITADYLISNIDEAFRHWKEYPWNKSMNYEQFCEFLLPYKANELQAFDSWREEYGRVFVDSIERLMSCSLYRLSAYQVAEAINNGLIKKYNMERGEYDIPQLFYRPATRLSIPFGTCDELCRPGISFFRAAGVPVAVDYVPVWGYGNRGHTWAVVLAPNGKEIPFVPLYMSPYTQHKINETIGKAYRETYAVNDRLVDLNTSGEWVPLVFKNVFQKDVTARYTMTRDIEFDVKNQISNYVYLCSPSRSVWKPVAFSKIRGRKALFRDVGVGCVFMLCQYDMNGRQTFVSEPLRINRDGDIETITPDFNIKTDVTLYRKAPLLEYAWNMAVKIEGGVFEASDTPDFRNPVWSGKVKTKADRAGEIVIPDSIGPHRYWRFIKRCNSDSARCYIGEISFYNSDSIINRQGRPIGTYTPDCNDVYEMADRAFDGDVLTSFSATRYGESWVGLDFCRPVDVDMIRYSPRSDGNMIEPGDEYELMYWYKGRWNSLGTKVATTVSVDYHNVPSKALYVLLNNTKGNSVRVFFIDDEGHQEWW